MPIHDWANVTAGTFHDFHLAWIAEMRRSLNAGLLPDGYYAQAEQVANDVIPDILTLQDQNQSDSHELSPSEVDDGGVAIALAPPKMALVDTLGEAMLLAARRRQLVIRHTTGDRIVALLEIVSPGNKQGGEAVDQFVEKAIGALHQGLHLQVIDLFPPGSSDPTGMHGMIWSRAGGKYNPPTGKPLTLAAYAATSMPTCYVEPTSVGNVLIDMPLFLNRRRYVNVPLEQTYLAAYEGVPKRWKKVIEGA